VSARRQLRFDLPLVHPVLGLTRRAGWLIEGEAGWGEWSPLPSWSGDAAARAYRAAVEAADRPFPDPVAGDVAVNVMVPRVSPTVAGELVASSGCSTAKVKVGDAVSVLRVAAVREALGATGRIRLDGNGAWDVDSAATMLAMLEPYGIELVEDPVATEHELRRLRRRVRLPLAAEMCIRSVEDGVRVATGGAVDAVVLKPQRLGGAAAALAVVERSPVPVIASSALESSVGLGAVLAVAAAVQPHRFAHGIATALLLAEDVTSHPLLPVHGLLAPRRVVPDRLLAATAPAA